MALATAHTVSLQGALGHLIDVQADVSPGMVGHHPRRPAGRLAPRGPRPVPDGRHNSGVPWPATRRVTILLSPSDLMKRGTHFDLAIALAVLAACGDVAQRSLDDTLVIGELTLTGGLRSVPGVLPMVMAASRRGFERVIVPEPQAREAAMVPGMTVLGHALAGPGAGRAPRRDRARRDPVAPMSGSRLIEWRGSRRLTEHDLSDLKGVPDVKYALGGGGRRRPPPDAVRARRGRERPRWPSGCRASCPTSRRRRRWSSPRIHSLAGALEPGDDLIRRPPFFAPHHDASKASLLGGGTGQGAARRGEPRPTAGCSSWTSSRCSAPT